MSKKIITWTLQYEVEDTLNNGREADLLYRSLQDLIEKSFPEGKQLIAYIHKEQEKP